MRKEILTLQPRIRATSIYVTHDQVEAITMADWIVFFFNDPATTEIYTAQYTLSLHDALPILERMILALRHGDDLRPAVHEHAGEVLPLVEDRRVRGTYEGHAHLAHDRDERLAQHLESDRIDHARVSRSKRRLPCASTAPPQPGGRIVVAPNSSTMAGPASEARSGSRSRSQTGQSCGAPSNHTVRRSTSAPSSEPPAPR